ncbi:MASE3 domain-containing sensor histidine kinase [Serpentinicella alkaliphila]|uniref:histidine kinase n=1 Tax=Serpentinicella alkaliphila TaxID=1734049 RepID=A0A4V2T476_9FIRM|nr:MASE3 domain-containing protein [Serpentinicella alkaliphila]QUH24461.1 PAS domain S-box protein [Serpentinicella alkaliphila]TCQ04144.1 PAS domain S-box-containing protein [Serpentinicella alkaliphila]
MSSNLLKDELSVKNLFLLLVFSSIMYFLSRMNHVFFHTLIEFICIMIAFNMLILSINTYKLNSKFYIIFLGIAFGFIGILDFLHMITFEGVNILPKESIEMTMVFWVAYRLMESISILIACFLINKKFNNKLKYIVITYLAITSLIIWSVYVMGIFSHTIDSKNLYSFRIGVETIAILILFISLIKLIKIKPLIDNTTYSYIKLSIILTLISEFLIIFYLGLYNTCFVLGNIFKLLSFYYLYKAIVQKGLKIPYTKLKKSETKYRKLIEASPDGIVIYNGRNIVYENQSFREILRIPTDSYVGTSDIYKYVPTELLEVFKKLDNLDDNYSDTVELNKILVNNVELSIEVVTTLIEFDGEMAILIIIRDINERVRAQELEKNRQALEQSKLYDKMKTEFISNIAHDLRTPLNIILGVSQLMNTNGQEYGSLDISKLRKYIHMIKQNSYRLLKLINNLIDMTKLEDRSLIMNYKNYNIIDVVENVTLSVASYVESKGIELTFDTSTEERVIKCDADLMERVVLNLISNAVKFTPKGGKIILNIYEEVEDIVITIEDTGIGIPKDVKDTIFNRFRQLDTPLHRQHLGSGIGLSLVKSIVEEHKGTITVDSQVGVGSIFSIRLPMENQVQSEAVFEEIAITNNTNIERINIEFSDIYSNNN